MMKIIPELTHNILPRSFSYGDNHYLVVTTILYMDIPTQEILKLDNLWNDAQNFLRADEPIDYCYPKNNAEFVIYGSCYSKEAVTVKEVGFKLTGKDFALQKELSVIGDRILRKNFLGKISISEPKKFNKMKIGYENAYGGTEFKKNPLGKGFDKKLGLNENIMMHNIDVKENPIVSYKDNNATAHSFEPSNIRWKGRVEKLGTYDENWQKNYWPYYAKDIDFDVFNSVAKDQRIDGFFRGDESFEIYNMHPEYPVVEGQLPNKIVKTFVTKMIEGEETLIELKTSIDTIIAFPKLQRVGIVNRAMIKVQDDEFSEIEKVFTVCESRDEKKHPMTYYEELMKKNDEDPLGIIGSIENTMPMDKTVDFADLNLAMEMALRQHLKESPQIFQSSKSLKLMQTKYSNYIDQYLSKKDLSTYESDALTKLKTLTNHNIINNTADKQLDDMQVHTKDLIDEKIKEAQIKYPDINIQKEFDQRISDIKNIPEMKEIKTDGYESILIRSWSDGARFFLGDKNYILKNSPKKYEELIKFGLREATINNLLYIGYNDEEEVIAKEKWIDNKEDIEVGIGYTLGYFQEDLVKKVVLREKIFDKDDNYLGNINDIVLNGSQESDLVLIGKKSEYIIIVDEIMEAYLLFQDFWQICSIVVMKNKDDFENSDYFIKNKDSLEYIFTTKFDLELDDIKTYNLNVKKNIYEEYKIKRDLEFEVLNELPDSKYILMMRKELKKKKRLGKKYAGSIDIKDQEDRITAAIFKSIDKAYDNEFLSHLDKKDKDLILSKMQNPNDVIKNNKIHNQDDLMKHINQSLKDIYKDNPTEEVKKKLKKYVSSLEDIKTLDKNASKDTKEKAKMATMKKSFKKYFDKELGKETMKFYTQEELSIQYQNTLDFSDSIFAIEEVENITFTNTNFKNSMWNNTIFRKVKFINCDLSNNTFNSCEFNESSFEESTMDKASFLNTEIMNSKYKNTSLEKLIVQGCELESVIFFKCKLSSAVVSDTNFTECDLRTVNLDDMIMSNNIINKTNFIECSLYNSTNTDLIISNCSFSKSNLSRMIVTTSDITDCDFTHIEGKYFFLAKEVTLKNVDFSNSMLDKMYTRDITVINSDFKNVSLNKSYIYTSVFKNCNMLYIDAKEANLQNSEFNNCDMQWLNLFKGNLTKTHLVESNLDNSNLYECIIFNTKFRDTSLENCNFNQTNLKDGKERYINED
jgi:uncharacterized protein YjbI with pentapeptide repeats